ncbi:hypothetical protein Taro_054382, partial [Colocasia esculenta]|nr:hypothetical protein [Colocasia esculenta]
VFFEMHSWRQHSVPLTACLGWLASRSMDVYLSVGGTLCGCQVTYLNAFSDPLAYKNTLFSAELSLLGSWFLLTLLTEEGSVHHRLMYVSTARKWLSTATVLPEPVSGE